MSGRSPPGQSGNCAPAHGKQPSRRLAITVAATFFPSRIQPWVLNSVEQLVAYGGEPTVFALQPSGSTWPEGYHRLGLDKRTCYVAPGEGKGVVMALRHMLSNRVPFGPASRRGLARIIRWGPSGLRRVASAVALAPAYGLAQTDVIHCHSTVIGYYMADVARALDVPMVLTFHGLPPTGVAVLSPTKQKQLFDACSRILVNTRFARAQVLSLGAAPEQVRILPQGLPLERFPFRPAEFDPSKPRSILTVGRLHPDKGHRYAIEAVAQLKSRGHRVNYRIVGVGPIRRELEQLASEMCLEEEVEFLGELTDSQLQDEYRRAHIFLLPSVRDREGHHEETQGVVLQEAQACGAIVVATRTGGIPECVDDGRSAFLVEDRDPTGLANALETVISTPGKWPHWQALGREWVKDNFDLEQIGRRQWDILTEAISEHRSYNKTGPREN